LKKEKNHKFQSCSVFKYVGRAVLWLIRMGGQKKRWFLYVFFLFQLSFLNLYVVAVVSKIDFRFNCVSMQCFIFDFFFSFTYHIRFISSKKTQKTFVWSVLHRWWKRLCDRTIKPTKKQDVLYTYFFLLLTTFLGHIL